MNLVEVCLLSRGNFWSFVLLSSYPNLLNIPSSSLRGVRSTSSGVTSGQNAVFITVYCEGSLSLGFDSLVETESECNYLLDGLF